MLQPSRGLVLRSTKYGDSSLIVGMYTEAFGMQSYLIKGIRSPRSKQKAGVFRPANVLDMVVYHREGRQLNHIREYRYALIYRSIPFDVLKSSIALFMVEILANAIGEEEPNPDLFAFVINTIKKLDESRGPLAYFHLHFLLDLSTYLGFCPGGKYSADKPFFDLREGTFVANPPPHEDFMRPDESLLLAALLEGRQVNQSPAVSRQIRQQLLKKLVTYYRCHLVNFKKMLSPAILEEVLRVY